MYQTMDLGLRTGENPPGGIAPIWFITWQDYFNRIRQARCFADPERLAPSNAHRLLRG